MRKNVWKCVPHLMWWGRARGKATHNPAAGNIHIDYKIFLTTFKEKHDGVPIMVCVE